MPDKKPKKPKKNQRRAVPSLKSADGLNPRQQQFILEYLIDKNATQAAIRAGYSVKTAGQTGYDLLKHPQILRAVCSGLEQLLAKPLSEAEAVIRESARLALSDVRRLFDEQGNLKAVTTLDDDIAPAIASVKVIERSKGKGETEVTREVRLWDKNSSLDRLSKYHKLLTDKIEQTTTHQFKAFKEMTEEERAAEFEMLLDKAIADREAKAKAKAAE